MIWRRSEYVKKIRISIVIRAFALISRRKRECTQRYTAKSHTQTTTLRPNVFCRGHTQTSLINYAQSEQTAFHYGEGEVALPEEEAGAVFFMGKRKVQPIKPGDIASAKVLESDSLHFTDRPVDLFAAYKSLPYIQWALCKKGRLWSLTQGEKCGKKHPIKCCSSIAVWMVWNNPFVHSGEKNQSSEFSYRFFALPYLPSIPVTSQGSSGTN